MGTNIYTDTNTNTRIQLRPSNNSDSGRPKLFRGRGGTPITKEGATVGCRVRLKGFKGFEVYSFSNAVGPSLAIFIAATL